MDDNKYLQLNCEEQFAESAIVIPNKIKLSLYKKSLNSGIPTNILEEVFRRGYSIWNEEFKGTREQFAFDRVNSFIAGGFASQVDIDLFEESLHDWFAKSKSKDGKKGWVQVGGKYSGKPCARQPGQTSTPKCRPSWEAAKMSKNEKEYAYRKKQKEDPNQPEKSGAAKPTYVKTYKEDIELQEKKDACYYKVKARFKVFPSAYASGALVQCRKKGSKNWGTKSEEYIDETNYSKGDFTPHELQKYANKKSKELIKITNLKRKRRKSKFFNENAEKQSKNPDDPSSRFDATKSLVKIYKQDTPGEPGTSHHKTKKVIKKIIKEIYVAGFEGKKIKVSNQNIRMASGKIEKHPPGKSGSSGGGDE